MIDTRNGKEEKNKYGWNKFGGNKVQTADAIVNYIRIAKIKSREYMEKA